MLFKVIPNSASHPSTGKSIAYLWADNWNDYWDYCTLYVLTYFDQNGVQHEIGGVKIGQFNWQKDQQRRPAIPNQFDRLAEEFFSLGQGEDFYSAIYKLGDVGLNILRALNDLVINPGLFDRARSEDVTQTSLLRSVANASVTGQFPRLLAGAARLTAYEFQYSAPSKIGNNEVKNVTLEFEVTPESSPPTNIHVIIGRNGVGKSYLLNSMVRSLVLEDKDPVLDGAFLTKTGFFGTSPDVPFANIVSVSFSAFDEFNLVPDVAQGDAKIAYSYVGLRELEDRDGKSVAVVRGPRQLASKFSRSAAICRGDEKRNRWRRALMALQADPLFAEANVVGLVESTAERDAFRELAEGLYRQKLSSGHKIVLLTITKLVETVEEKTLVLMDEPEAHLHPPLLSAFVRALSELLVNRNGVAIIATHSPVVLQEVPSSCVWKITRFGSVSQADRVAIETFAENVGVLTREVFGLEVEETGFHKLLSDAAAGEDSIEKVTGKFSGAVGAEGRALISGLIANRGRDTEFNDL